MKPHNWVLFETINVSIPNSNLPPDRSEIWWCEGCDTEIRLKRKHPKVKDERTRWLYPANSGPRNHEIVAKNPVILLDCLEQLTKRVLGV